MTACGTKQTARLYKILTFNRVIKSELLHILPFQSDLSGLRRGYFIFLLANYQIS